MKLNDRTKELIGNFTMDAISNSLVECVYYSCFLKENCTCVEVTAIMNKSLYYKEKLSNIMNQSDIYDSGLHNLIMDYNLIKEINDNQVVSFRYEDASNYSLLMMHYREKFAIMNLVSGYIVYDRFGEKSILRNRALEQNVEPYPNVYEIDNPEVSSVKVIVKK